MSDFWQIDGPVFVMAALSGLACSLLGSVLMLRREVMLADALSHSVLPGLAAGYLLTGILAPPVMMLGALAACGLAILMTRLIVRCGPFSRGAALGISFTVMFALGVILIEKFVGGRVHLDVEHALYGAIELTYWPEPGNLATLPQGIWMLLAVNILNMLFLFLFRRPLKVVCFDADYAKVAGAPAVFVGGIFYVLVIASIVASFQAVGAVLVIALLTCPAAAARLVARSYEEQLCLAAVFGVLSGVLGYILAGFVPLWFGFDFTLSAAGMIAVVSGIFVVGMIMVSKVLRA